ncbi:MAG: adenylate/guanylate cyclase domain-containing protein [Deltaproteobacteria bacterium]|nr:adenylate/guanylate cyclase domain-containing protein [Deltaproteobacteria bacterium]
MAVRARGKKVKKQPVKPAARPARKQPKARAKSARPAATALELAHRLALNSFADGLLEECSRDKMSLRATLDRFLPAIAARLGAVAGLVRTRDEQLALECYESGAWSDDERAGLSRETIRPVTRAADGRRTIIAQPLDVGGRKVGVAAFAFAGDRRADSDTLAARIDIVCEQFDDVLASIQQAGYKQELIVRLQQALKNVVFDRGVDDAVSALGNAIPLRDLVLIYQDDAGDGSVSYRIYRDGLCTHDAESRPHRHLQELIDREGATLLDHSRAKIAPVLGIEGALESVLIAGLSTRALGKILATADNGLSTFGLDLLRVFAECVSQRLVDYNRERRHLSQFFGPAVINELLQDPNYTESYLSPRTEEVALIYADINSFTKISEQILLDPGKIGRFVDRWSAGAVDILWKNGGVFDKMVGDCVIGIFGPPFFRTTPRQRITAAVKASREILAFTIGLEADPELAQIAASPVVPGLGVAVGLNLCPASVGLFGPNQDFTAFSSGMNATARLQSLAGFREILIMDSARDALGDLAAPIRDARFEGPLEAPVKNVARPLTYYRITSP